MNQEQNMISLKEAMKYLDISRTTLHRLTKEGMIPAYKVGRLVKYKREEIDEFLRKQRTKEGESL